MKIFRRKSKGQILVMVTFALMAMLGMLGLAVDLGWAYFVKKSAQSAADSAALAAALNTLETVGEEGPWDCVGMSCQEVTPCPQPVPDPPSGNIEVGCLYALHNGFQEGGHNGRQRVLMNAGVTANPPTAPGVNVHYWVTARVSEDIPQLFSFLISPVMNSGARATAAVLDSAVPGSLFLLNRENDCLPMGTSNSLICGVNALIQANNNQGFMALEAQGGMVMASTKNGTSPDGRYAGENSGGGQVSAPFTFIRQQGSYVLSGGSAWQAPPKNINYDHSMFLDPVRGKGQPSPPTGLTDFPVLGNVISGTSDPGNPLVLQPGNYFGAAQDNQGQLYATGAPIRLSGNIVFSDGGTGFGDYVFFGGITNQSAGTQVVFSPGRYVFAGVKPQGANPSSLFDIRVNMVINDKTSGYGAPQDAGEIFVFTDANYSGGPDGTQGLEIPPLVQPIASQLVQGKSGFQSGNTDATIINLHGLNRDHPLLPAELRTFSPIIIWQDQANSIIKYTGRGYIDTSCGLPECPNTALVAASSTELSFQASPNLHLWGVSYQPRGSWTSMNGGGGYDAPLQLITGAIRVHANSNVRLRELPVPLMRTAVGLVE